MRANRELRPLIGEASLAVRPSNQLAAQELIQPPQRRHGKYRFYYAVVFRQKGRASSSVLLGGSSIDEIETLGAELLAFRDSICGAGSLYCTVFPYRCSISLDMRILVNGAMRNIPWRSTLASIAPAAGQIEIVRRLGEGRTTSLSVNTADPEGGSKNAVPG